MSISVKQMRVVKKIDFRPVDLETGKRLPLSPCEMHECACCGKHISKAAVMNHGGEVGLECANVLELLYSYPAQFLGASAKQTAYWELHAS